MPKPSRADHDHHTQRTHRAVKAAKITLVASTSTVTLLLLVDTALNPDVPPLVAAVLGLAFGGILGMIVGAGH